MATIGMSVPGATDLGLGSTLSQQTADETEAARKRRLLAEAQQKLVPGSSPPSNGASSLMSGYSAATPFA